MDFKWGMRWWVIFMRGRLFVWEFLWLVRLVIFMFFVGG